MSKQFVLTREAAIRQLQATTSRLGLTYASDRNTDAGPDADATTSALSPYLRRRLLLEEEVVAAAMSAHGSNACKFVSEVFWRTYFKGFLETHPGIWNRYVCELSAEQRKLVGSSGLRRTYEKAVGGETGIGCFDEWAQELVATGWLHNHTRMWFASIWIFTLRLPWTLGADFFLRHLIDGDPASNTLSWRWVAGLHTRGRVYAARAENIRRYTGGRHSPVGLNENPEPLEEPTAAATCTLPPAGTVPDGDIALLLHLDDLQPESLPLGSARVARVGGIVAHAPGATEAVRRADAQAMADALERAQATFGCPAATVDPGWEDGLPVAAAWAPVGPSASALPSGCVLVRRRWDDLAWPRATRGYYGLKAAIPRILEHIGGG